MGGLLLLCAAGGCCWPAWRLLQGVAFRDEKKAPRCEVGAECVGLSMGCGQPGACIRGGNAVGAGVVPGVGVALFDVRLRVSPVLCNRFCGIVSVWAEVSSCFLAAHMTRLSPAAAGLFRAGWVGFPT